MLDPESFIALESIQEPEKCVGVEDNGSMKAAENCTSSDNHAMFGVHLIVRLCHILCHIFAGFFYLWIRYIFTGYEDDSKVIDPETATIFRGEA